MLIRHMLLRSGELLVAKNVTAIVIKIFRVLECTLSSRSGVLASEEEKLRQLARPSCIRITLHNDSAKLNRSET